MMTSRNPCCFRSKRFHTINGVPAMGRSGFGIVFVSGLRRVPNPAARIMAFMEPRRLPSHLSRHSLQFRHVGGEMLPEPVQFWILLEISFDIVQDTRNIGKEPGIAFDPIDVDEAARCFKVTLDT